MDQELKEYREKLKEHREKLIEIEKDLSFEFDRRLILLSGGALGLSITFIKNIVGSSEPNGVHIIVWGWILLAGCLLLALINNYIGTLTYRITVKRLDEEKKPPTHLICSIHVLNIVCILLLIAGIILVASFAALNMGGKNESRAAQTTATEADVTTFAATSSDTRAWGSSIQRFA